MSVYRARYQSQLRQARAEHARVLAAFRAALTPDEAARLAAQLRRLEHIAGGKPPTTNQNGTRA